MAPNDPDQPLPTTPVPAPQSADAPSSAQTAGRSPQTPAASSAVPSAQPQWGAPPPPSWGQPQWGPPPSAQVPTPVQPRRDRSALVIVACIFGGLLLVFVGFLALVYLAVRGDAPRLGAGPRIGVVYVKGPIGMGGRGSVDSEEVMKLVKRYTEDDDMKAVVVRIDSPGGAVAPSQEIYDELQKLAESKTVVCSMGSLAASGGFYVAMACDKIVAEPGTLTGSIGVISQFPNVKGLAEKFNVKMETVKSGKLKDAGNPFRDMTQEDRAYWQGLIDNVYQQFVGAVVDSRGIEEAEVKKFADGRVITGEQAQKLGLVDEIGNFYDAIDLAKEEADLQGEPRLVYPPDDRIRFWEDLLGGFVGTVADAVRSEVKKEAVGAEGPGVYYLAR